MPTIVHFDIPAFDPERAGTFYERVFGWKMTDIPGPVPYRFVATTDSQGHAGIGGGISKRMEGEKGGITHFIGVESIDEYLSKVESAGGMVLEGKMSVPGYGFLAVCRDTEGNRFGLWESDAHLDEQ